MVDILTDSLHRIAYATDASAYRELPLGVAYPEYDEDIISLIGKAREMKTCLIPRAAGTSIAGLLMQLGYEVEIPRHTESGRASISKGELRHARRCARASMPFIPSKSCIIQLSLASAQQML